MKNVVTFGVLALLGVALALPVIDQTEDNKSSNSLPCKGRIRKCNRKLPRKRKPFAELISYERKNSDIARIKDFLTSYGYTPTSLTPETYTLDKSNTTNQLLNAFWKFATWNGVKMGKKLFMRKVRTFERTLARITQKRRCGDPDIGKGAFKGSERIKRYVAQTPWGKTALTYKIESFDNDLSEEVQRAEIAKAFKLWTDASELTVSEVQGSTPADINIRFASGSHGDMTPFDGPGLVVAHAFYPEDGRIHFDSDETFTTGGDTNKVNLLSIAAHEIGHALGLGHSAESDSVMHAQYQPYSADFSLSQDDINGIKYLYPSNTAGGCVDDFFCQDIQDEDCPVFIQFCKNRCNACN